MLNIRGIKVYTQDELMENLASSIKRTLPFALQSQHVNNIAIEIGDMVGESKEHVIGYLSKTLKLPNP